MNLEKLKLKESVTKHRFLFWTWTNTKIIPDGWKYTEQQLPSAHSYTCPLCLNTNKFGIKDNGDVIHFCRNCEVIHKTFKVNEEEFYKK